MKKDLLKKVAQTFQTAQSELKKLTPSERTRLEEKWDREHTYYSSALEGSMVDREDVERLTGSVQ